jgi:hypothetical protein
VKLRVWKSLTFFIGLVLFVAAFGVILVAGSIFNPPPYRIVIVLGDIAPYTVLTRNMLAIDEQTMNSRVASRLVHEEEIDDYLGGMVIETIHAGEALRRNAVVAADNPAVTHRLSLALTDPDMVAAVIPVNPEIIPDNVTAGDYINVTMGIAGNVSQLTTATWGETADTTWGAPLANISTPTPPSPFTSTLPFTSTGTIATGSLSLDEEIPEVAPPMAKIVLPQVQMIDVTRKRVPNPNYGMTFGQEGAQEPPFLEGDIESITILVPKAAEELLYFAVDNGTLHISVVPHVAVLEGTSPSTGVLWEDVVFFFQEERLRALGMITASIAVAPSSSPTMPVTPGAALTETTTSPPTADTASPGEAAGQPPGEAPPANPSTGSEQGSGQNEPPGSESIESGETSFLSDLTSNLSDYLLPVCIGGGLVIGLGAIGFALMRRRKG